MMPTALDTARDVLLTKARVPRIKRRSYKYVERRKPLPDYTDIVIDALKRPLITYLTEWISFVLVGTMGYGKTVLVNWIVHKIIEHYGVDQVNAISHKGADLDALIDNLDSKPVQVLLLDDSFGKMKKDILADFFLVRHTHAAVRQAEGFEEMGLIIGFFGIQNLYGLDENARRVSDFLLAKSSTGDKWYRRDIAGTFGEEGLNQLDKIAYKVLIEKNQEAKSTCVARITGLESTGILKSGIVPNQFRLVEAIEKDEPDYASYLPKQGAGEHFKTEFISEDPDRPFGAKVILKLKDMGVPLRDRGIFAKYLDGESSSDIAKSKEINLTSRRISQIVQDIREKKLGYAAEKVLAELNPRWEYGGSNTDAPDHIDHEGRRVISQKCYMNPDLTPGSGNFLSKKVGKKEIEAAIEFGYDLELWLFEMYRGIWLKWKLPLPDPSLPEPENPTTEDQEDEKEGLYSSLLDTTDETQDD